MLVANSIEASLDKDLFNIVGKVTSGEDAIEKFQKTNPDLVLMDINLKEKMDGIEAASRIQKINDRPIVFLTAYSDQTTIRRLKSISAYGYILKPFRKRELNVVIEMALNKYDYEKKIEEGNKRYRGLVDNAPIGILSINIHGQIMDINPELLYIFGFSSIAAAQKINIFEYKPMIQSGIAKKMKDSFEENEIIKFECTYVAESEKYIILRNIVKPDLDKDDKPHGGLLLVEDITETSEVENELSDAEEKLSMVLLGSDIEFFDFNINTGEIFCSSNGECIICGVPGELDMSFDSWKNQIHPDDISNLSFLLNSLYEEKVEYFESEYRIKTKSGKMKWIISKGAVIKRDKERAPLRMIGTNQDITEYKEGKEICDLYKLKHQVMMENFPFLAILWEYQDDEFLLIEYNKNLIEKSMSEILNYKGIEANIYFKDYSIVVDEMKKCFAEKGNILGKKVSYQSLFSSDARDVFFNFVYVPDSCVLVYIDEDGKTLQKEH